MITLILQRGLFWVMLLVRLGYYTLAVYGLFVLVFWYSDNNPVVLFGDGTLHPVVVKPGDSVTVNQPIKKLRDCPGTVYRYLSGDCGIFSIMWGDTTLPSGFDADLRIVFEVPQTAQPGNCVFSARHQYYCNPLDLLFNRKHVSPESLYFKVME